ncbi:MAG: hypothetical protein AAB731_02440 [Patescibacteria group bacterium]
MAKREKKTVKITKELACQNKKCPGQGSYWVAIPRIMKIAGMECACVTLYCADCQKPGPTFLSAPSQIRKFL